MDADPNTRGIMFDALSKVADHIDELDKLDAQTEHRGILEGIRSDLVSRITSPGVLYDDGLGMGEQSTTLPLPLELSGFQHTGMEDNASINADVSSIADPIGAVLMGDTRTESGPDTGLNSLLDYLNDYSPHDIRGASIPSSSVEGYAPALNGPEDPVPGSDTLLSASTCPKVGIDHSKPGISADLDTSTLVSSINEMFGSDGITLTQEDLEEMVNDALAASEAIFGAISDDDLERFGIYIQPLHSVEGERVLSPTSQVLTMPQNDIKASSGSSDITQDAPHPFEIASPPTQSENPSQALITTIYPEPVTHDSDEGVAVAQPTTPDNEQTTVNHTPPAVRSNSAPPRGRSRARDGSSRRGSRSTGGVSRSVNPNHRVCRGRGQSSTTSGRSMPPRPTPRRAHIHYPSAPPIPQILVYPISAEALPAYSSFLCVSGGAGSRRVGARFGARPPSTSVSSAQDPEGPALSRIEEEGANVEAGSDLHGPE